MRVWDYRGDLQDSLLGGSISKVTREADRLLIDLHTGYQVEITLEELDQLSKALKEEA